MLPPTIFLRIAYENATSCKYIGRENEDDQKKPGTGYHIPSDNLENR